MRFFGALKNIARKLTGKTVLDAQAAGELEEALLSADVSYETTEKILRQLEASAAHPEGVEAGLKNVLVDLLVSGGETALAVIVRHIQERPVPASERGLLKALLIPQPGFARNIVDHTATPSIRAASYGRSATASMEPGQHTIV